MEPTNIKISFKICTVSLSTVQELCPGLGYKFKAFPNFLVVRPNTSIGEVHNWVCTVFKKNIAKDALQHVNVTNIKSFDDIDSVISHLTCLRLIVLPGTVRIDNVTGLMQVRELIIPDIIRSIQQNEKEVCLKLDTVFWGTHSLTVHYNNERFPGLFIKFKRNSLKSGTAIVFHSGKIVIIGCKNLTQLRWVSKAVNALISIK